MDLVSGPISRTGPRRANAAGSRRIEGDTMDAMDAIPHRLRRLILAGALLAIPVLVVACTDAGASPTGAPGSASSPPSAPTASASPAASPARPAAPTPSPSPVASKPTQSETSWGRIWDAVPPGFPVPAGGTPAQADAPVSAAYDVDTPAEAVATALQQAMETAGYSTEALSGPLEDGSRVLDSTGEPAGCRVQTTIAPLGSLTRVTVLYGAGCPF
jgi:hypothetical protein